jgi:hypothetical protein
VSSPRQRLATLLLGRDVIDVITEQRANKQSWPAIRQYIKDATDGEIDVSHQALQQWFYAAQDAESGVA